jgi:hypothetical protein
MSDYWALGGLLLGLCAVAMGQSERNSRIDMGVLTGEAQPANRWLVRMVKQER